MNTDREVRDKWSEVNQSAYTIVLTYVELLNINSYLSTLENPINITILTNLLKLKPK